MSSAPHHITASAHITLIDGSAGLRHLLRAFISSRWTNANIIEVDPFSQTMRGVGVDYGSISSGTQTQGSVIILGGIGTQTEAEDALKRLTSQHGCPPIILLVSANLMAQEAYLQARGAFAIFHKESISFNRLGESLIAALNGSPAPIEKNPHTCGQFSFVEEGKRHVLEINGYRYLSNLASGARAQVFFAEHIESTRRAVIKVQTSTPIQNVESLAAVCERALALSRQQSGHLVGAIDSGLTAAFPYAVLEYLPHGDLRQHCKAPMNIDTKLSIVLRIFDALVALHTTGYVHADLKPESVFFRADNSIVLIDFNISTKFGHRVSASISGDVFGTPTYMSPEQGAGMAVDASADIYSVGVILFELLAGVPPFSGDTPAQTIFRHIHDEIPLLPLKLRQYQSVVDGMLAKHPSERYQTAAAAKSALEAAIQAAIETVLSANRADTPGTT